MILNRTCHLLNAWALAACFTFAAAASVSADPTALNDRELDAVSARGFSFPSFGYNNVQPTNTSVFPFVPTQASADSNVGNLNLSIANTTNVVTAIHQCILSNCNETSADVTANPTAESQASIVNNITPTVNNSSMVPTNIVTPTLGNSLSFAAPQSLAPPPAATTGGSTFRRQPPPLPRFSPGFGGR